MISASEIKKYMDLSGRREIYCDKRKQQSDIFVSHSLTTHSLINVLPLSDKRKG